MKYLIFILLSILPVLSRACEVFPVPIEVVNESGNEPTNDTATEVIILAPEKHKGWQLRGASLQMGKSQIPLAKFYEPELYPEVAVFSLRAVKQLFQESYVLITYIPLPINGVDAVSMCAHFEKVEWGM